MSDKPVQPPPGLKFGATVIYVDDVPTALAFHGRAFGLATRFYDPQHEFGELETGGENTESEVQSSKKDEGSRGRAKPEIQKPRIPNLEPRPCLPLQIFKNIFRRYIQNRMSQMTASTASPRSNGSYGAPRSRKKSAPRWVLKASRRKPTASHSLQ